MEASGEHLRPPQTIGERVRKRLDHIFHPASSASREAFQSIIAVLPAGEMKKSMEQVMPQLREMLKVQDRGLVISSIMQRVIVSLNFGIFGGIGGAAIDAVTGFTGVGTVTGILTGIAGGNAIPTPSQNERSRIAVVAKQQEMMLRTSGGKEAAKVFDAKKVDQITQAILWGSAAQGGGGGVLSQAANPMT